jgi:hypothetical protein
MKFLNEYPDLTLLPFETVISAGVVCDPSPLADHWLRLYGPRLCEARSRSGAFYKYPACSRDARAGIVGLGQQSLSNSSGVSRSSSARSFRWRASPVIVLLVAIFTVHLPNGFSSIKLQAVTAAGPYFGQPGYETDLLYLAGLIALVLGGSGPLALDRIFIRRPEESGAEDRQQNPGGKDKDHENEQI